MKQLLVILLFLASFTGFAQQKEEWQDWEKTSCYSKIFFRLKYEGRNGSRHIWKVQFRNEYESTVSFNYHSTVEKNENQPTTHRKTLLAKAKSTELEVYTNTDNIYLIVDKLSMSAYPVNFVDCE